MFLQQLQLLWILEQRQHTIADEVDRGLVSGNNQQGDRGEQFHFREGIVILMHFNQLADQIILGMLSLLCNQCPQIPGISFKIKGFAIRELHRGRLFNESIGPVMKAPSILQWNPQQLTNDGNGQRECEIMDELHVSLPLYLIQQLIGNLLNMAPEPLDRPRRKRLGDEMTQPGMIWRIHLEHVVAKDQLLWSQRLRVLRRIALPLLTRRDLTKTRIL